MGIRLGLCQTRVTRDKGENLRLAEAALRQAADQGANLALLPEMFNCPYENPCFPLYGEPAGGETWQFLAAMARELGLYLAGGSVPELEGDKVYNTCYLFSPQGEELARHRAGGPAVQGVRHLGRRQPDHGGGHPSGHAGPCHLL